MEVNDDDDDDDAVTHGIHQDKKSTCKSGTKEIKLINHYKSIVTIKSQHISSSTHGRVVNGLSFMTNERSAHTICGNPGGKCRTFR